MVDLMPLHLDTFCRHALARWVDWMCMQAGPPYAVDPNTLRTLGNQPELLNGFLIDGIAPSTTGSDFLDQV